MEPPSSLETTIPISTTITYFAGDDSDSDSCTSEGGSSFLSPPTNDRRKSMQVTMRVSVGSKSDVSLEEKSIMNFSQSDKVLAYDKFVMGGCSLSKVPSPEPVPEIDLTQRMKNVGNKIVPEPLSCSTIKDCKKTRQSRLSFADEDGSELAKILVVETHYSLADKRSKTLKAFIVTTLSVLLLTVLPVVIVLSSQT